MNPRYNRLLVGVILAAFLAGIAFTGGVIFASGTNRMTPVLAALNIPQANQGDTTKSVLPGMGPNTVADIVAGAGLAVVKIETTVPAAVDNPFFNDPFFRHFFGQGLTPLPEPRAQKGLGSGFLISADGYLLTNEHVIEGARQIQVTVMGYSKPLSAQVVGSDRELDLAVLKVSAGANLPYLKLGDSDQIRVGNWVIAIGNPYGLDHTVTVGVISAKGRPIGVEDRHYRNLLQTDASINPGNSGGPLLDLDGEVIGINTAVSAQAQGIGFAVPSNTVKDVLDELMNKGSVSRAWLGVEIQDVTPEIASAFGFNDKYGVVIRTVVGGGPAASAGLRKGDIITGWNKAKVVNTDDLLNKIKQAGAGSKVQLTVWRDLQQTTVAATLGVRPSPVR